MTEATTLRWARSVTPLLYVAPGEVKRPCTEVETAQEAHDFMLQGMTVMVPNDDVARETLRSFGADEEHIETRIRFSHPDA